MGTNFYWNDRPCGTCGRHDTIHVGKRSRGWSFNFHALIGQSLLNDDKSDTIFGFDVITRRDWKRVFTERHGFLSDEYGERIDDPLTWIDDLEPPDDTQVKHENTQLGHYAVDTSYKQSRLYPHNLDWRDDEGFRFTAGEFC